MGAHLVREDVLRRCSVRRIDVEEREAVRPDHLKGAEIFAEIFAEVGAVLVGSYGAGGKTRLNLIHETQLLDVSC